MLWKSSIGVKKIKIYKKWKIKKQLLKKVAVLDAAVECALNYELTIRINAFRNPQIIKTNLNFFVLDYSAYKNKKLLFFYGKNDKYGQLSIVADNARTQQWNAIRYFIETIFCIYFFYCELTYETKK